MPGSRMIYQGCPLSCQGEPILYGLGEQIRWPKCVITTGNKKNFALSFFNRYRSGGQAGHPHL